MRRDPFFGPVSINGRPGNTIQQGAELLAETNLYVRREIAGFNICCIVEDTSERRILRIDEDSVTLGLLGPLRGSYRIAVALPPLWLSPGIYSLFFGISFRGDYEKSTSITRMPFPWTYPVPVLAAKRCCILPAPGQQSCMHRVCISAANNVEVALNATALPGGIIDRCTMNVASSVWHCLRLNRCSIGRQPPQSPAVRKCGTTRTILGVCSGEVARCFGTAGNRGKRVRHGGVGAVPSSATRSLAATCLMQWSLRVVARIGM